MGSSLSKQKSLFIVILFAFLLGALITCAEPSILIIAGQVNINPFVLIGCIAAGVGIFVVLGVLRIIYQGSLKIWYLFFYFITFLFICLIALDDESRKFLPFVFDAGGVTTGSATVPFILSLGAGVAIVRGGKHANEDSFGLVGMASIGPILTMAILILVNRNGFSDYKVPVVAPFTDAGMIGKELIRVLLPNSSTGALGQFVEVAMATLPIIIIFFIYEAIFIKLKKAAVMKLLIGFVYTYVGLVIFLMGINAIMSPFGTRVGEALGTINNNFGIIAICFLLGLLSILCEPAVHVLTGQIKEVSDGQIKKSTTLIALAVGVGFAIALGAIRSIYNFSIMYYIVPGYALSIGLMFVCPNIYTAMAFDSGGTASGPMSVSFVLPLVIGMTKQKFDIAQESTIYYERCFGVVSMIALTPILAIQFLGLYQEAKKRYQYKIMRGQINDPADQQIIHF